MEKQELGLKFAKPTAATLTFNSVTLPPAITTGTNTYAFHDNPTVLGPCSLPIISDSKICR